MEVRVEYDYTGEERDELTIKQGDIVTNVSQFEEGWYIGTLNGKEGVFPDNFVKVITRNSPKPERMQERPSSNLAIHDESQKYEYVKVIFQYSPEQSDELELQINDVIKVMDRNLPEEGWWRGQNIKTKKIGVFPDNFVKLINSNDADLGQYIAEASNKNTMRSHQISGHVSRSNERPTNGDGNGYSRPSSGGPSSNNKSKYDFPSSKPVQFLDSTLRSTASNDYAYKKPVGTVDEVNPTAHCLTSITSDRPKLAGKRPTSKQPVASSYSRVDAKPFGKQDNIRINNFQNSPTVQKPVTSINSPQTTRKLSTRHDRTEGDSVSTAAKHPPNFISGRVRGSSANRADSLRTGDLSTKSSTELQQLIKDQQRQLDAFSLQASQLTSQIDNMKKGYQDRMNSVESQIHELRNQFEDTYSGIKSDISRNQKLLIERFQSLMCELDEVQKSRSSDAVELVRVKKLMMQYDTRSLSSPFVSASASGEALHGRLTPALPYESNGHNFKGSSNFQNSEEPNSNQTSTRLHRV